MDNKSGISLVTDKPVINSSSSQAARKGSDSTNSQVNMSTSPRQQSIDDPTAKPNMMPDFRVEPTVSKINTEMQRISRDLKFTVERETGRTIITVLDEITKEVIREIPPENIRKLAHILHDHSGIFDDQA